MTKQTLALVGEGVTRRADWLRSQIDPKWEISVSGGEGNTKTIRNATAAIGMPRAIEWRNEIPSLRLLQLPGAGLDGLSAMDVPDGCVVCNVYRHEASVAEYVFSSLFYLTSKWIEHASSRLKAGAWVFFDRVGGESRPSICGRRFGVVGFGHIARRCAEVAVSLDMEVSVYTRTIRSRSELERKGICFVSSVEELARTVDVFLVACPLTPQTVGLVNEEVLQCMHPHTIVINVARAQVVDEGALFDAVSAQKIGGAILDVWYRYPTSGSDNLTGSEFPFHLLDNVVVTPHLAANTEHMVRRRWEFMAGNVNNFVKGRALENVVSLA